MFLGHAATMGDGPGVSHQRSAPWRRSKHLTALTAALLGKDYWQFKLLTPGVWQAARNAGREAFDAVLVNFLYATPLLSTLTQRTARLLVDTHNYDPSVFGGFRDATRNPLTRMLCNRAIRTSRQALSRLPGGTVMVHVSERDAAGWRRDRPDLRHEVIENGCSVLPRAAGPAYPSADRWRLLFVGSLSAQMNQNALEHLAGHFWPQLHDLACVRVVGSNPPAAVSRLCAAHGWELWADVSEQQLAEAYGWAHFAVLPFAYGAGSKLKLVESCGRGVPVLSTTAGTTGVAKLPALVQVSDDPAAWRRRLQDFRNLEATEVAGLVEFAREYSWLRLARRYVGLIKGAEPALIA
jgi:glycosyltransferase involved in cell wall biosynthesis